jgi:acetyltransferase
LVEDLECGLRAIQHLVAYAAFRRRATNHDDMPSPTPLGLDAGVTLTEAQSKTILGHAGLPVTQEHLAATPDDAAAAAARIAGPVAIKVQSADIPHKSDVGGVALDVSGAEAVRAAASRVLANARAACPEAKIDGVLVQQMITGGVEVILGMVNDPQFGPLIVLGAGGVLVEVFKDAAVALPPLSRADVERMIDSLKVSKMLGAFRGAAPRDREALIDCVLTFSRFVVATDGQLEAIDLNPVIVGTTGRGVSLADALIVTRRLTEDT